MFTYQPESLSNLRVGKCKRKTLKLCSVIPEDRRFKCNFLTCREVDTKLEILKDFNNFPNFTINIYQHLEPVCSSQVKVSDIIDCLLN